MRNLYFDLILLLAWYKLNSYYKYNLKLYLTFVYYILLLYLGIDYGIVWLLWSIHIRAISWRYRWRISFVLLTLDHFVPIWKDVEKIFNATTLVQIGYIYSWVGSQSLPIKWKTPHWRCLGYCLLCNFFNFGSAGVTEMCGSVKMDTSQLCLWMILFQQNIKLQRFIQNKLHVTWALNRRARCVIEIKLWNKFT